jgi:hypothetical protein
MFPGAPALRLSIVCPLTGGVKRNPALGLPALGRQTYSVFPGVTDALGEGAGALPGDVNEA